MVSRTLMVLLVALLTAPSLLLAQDRLTQTFVSEDERLSLHYPEGWLIYQQGGATNIMNDEQIWDRPAAQLHSGETLLNISFSDEPLLQAMFVGNEPAAIINNIVGYIGAEDVGEFTSPATFFLGNDSGARSYGTINGNDVFIIVIDISGNPFELVMGLTAPGEMSRFEPKLLAIAETVRYIPVESLAPVAVNPNALQTITLNNAD